MGRRLTFLAYALVVFIAGKSFALGLGEIELDSALNQNFSATIPVTGSGGLTDYEVLVSLANADDFKRVGVERFFYLTNIRFVITIASDGSLVIVLSTPQPVAEPYLNFLVEVRWPNGRLLKEFTVLLDPPTFSDKQASAVTAPVRSDPSGGGRSEPSSSSAVKNTNNTAQNDRQTTQRSTPSQTQNVPKEVSQERFEQLTNRDDTLWQIASDVRPSGSVSIQQTMLAIQRLNPRAFIRGNINLLKAGYNLELPSEADIQQLSGQQANQEVAEHNKQWDAYRSGASLEDLSPKVETPTPAQTASDLGAQLDATSSTAESAVDGPSKDGQLRIISGSGDSSAISSAGDNDDVQPRSSAETAEEIERISRENDELQYRLDRLTELEAQAKQQNDAKSQQIELQDKRLAELQAQLEQAQSVTANSGAGTNKSSFMELLTSPLVLILGFLVVLLTAGLIFVGARARRELDEAYEAIHEEGVDETEDDAEIEPLVFESEASDEEYEEHIVDENEQDDLDDTTDPLDSENLEGAQTSDVVGEADIYIAYGRYPQALALLNTAIDNDPSRAEVRLKLLEIYAETEDQAMFDNHMQVLTDTCDNEDILTQAREIDTQFNSEGQYSESDDAGDVQDEVEIGGQASSVDADSLEREELENSLDEDFDLELDDEELSDESGTAAGIESVSDSEDESGEDSEKLGGDLGIDFDPGDQPTEIRELGDDEFDLGELELVDSEEAAAVDSNKDPDGDEAFDFLDEEDASSTKLDLARAYIDMGDEDGAREILAEVVSEGNEEQQTQANELLAQLK